MINFSRAKIEAEKGKTRWKNDQKKKFE